MTEFIALSTARLPHPIFTMLLAMLISGVVALLGPRNRRDRLYHASYLLFTCIATVLAGSWIMYLVHG